MWVRKKYRDTPCPCGKVVTLSSKSGLCKSCAGKKKVFSEEHRLNISKAKMGHKMSPEHRERLRAINTGMKHSPERRMKNSLRQRGSKSHFWRGGVTATSKLLRSSIEYKNWRTAVFERDDYTCVFCGERGCELQADHIKPFASFPELRLDISNGRTLCVPCHKETDTYLWKGRKINSNIETL